MSLGFIKNPDPTPNALHCWTVCFGSGVADDGVADDGFVLFCCFSFLLSPFSERAETEANDVSSFFLN